MRRSQAPSAKRARADNDENVAPALSQFPTSQGPRLTASSQACSGVSLGGFLGLALPPAASGGVNSGAEKPSKAFTQPPGPAVVIKQFKPPLPSSAYSGGSSSASLGMRKKYGPGVDLLAAMSRRVHLDEGAEGGGAACDVAGDLLLYDPAEHRAQWEAEQAREVAAAAAAARGEGGGKPTAAAAAVLAPLDGAAAAGAGEGSQTPAAPPPLSAAAKAMRWDERVKVCADSFLVAKLRPHQREGVKFVFECLSGVRKDGISGAVLADGMGLGKTFQTIASMYCLLTKGVFGKPTCRKPLVLCPTSLVQNWGKEVKHWLGDRVEPVVVDDTRADQVKHSFQDFRGFSRGNKPKVLVMSYPCFRMHKAEVYKLGIDCVLCDEAHFLKNGEAQITQAVAGLSATRRLLMSGTPIQNDLSEFHAVFDLACPGLLGDLNHFRKAFELPIQRGRDADATDKQITLGLQRMAELMATCNTFMLRRTSTVLKALLPTKVEQVVFCKLSPLQLKLYRAFLDSRPVQALLASTELDEETGVYRKRKSTKAAKAPAAAAGGGTGGEAEGEAAQAAAQVEEEAAPAEALAPLVAITALKKLCCHPDLIWEMLNKHKVAAQQEAQKAQLLQMYQANRRTSARAAASGPASYVASGLGDESGEEGEEPAGGRGGRGGKGGRGGGGRGSGRGRRASSGSAKGPRQQLTGFEGCESLFVEAGVYPPYQAGRCQAYHSGKVMVLEALLKAIRTSEPSDKVVLVSNYTEALDVLRTMCDAHGWASLRLDGSCSVKQRQALVDTFNDPQHPSFVLLLSSKAGGVGLNIIGANRLVLFDPDWNPANDLQAMARVWREGQRKRVWIYRMLMAGSIEEKVLQRQLAKQGLSEALVDDIGQQQRTFSRDELRSLFRVNPETACETHKAIKCKCDGSVEAMESCRERAAAAAGGEGGESGGEQQGVLAWAHLASAADSPDPTWQAMASFTRDKFVTYVFSDHVLDEQPPPGDQVLGGLGAKKRRPSDSQDGSSSGGCGSDHDGSSGSSSSSDSEAGEAPGSDDRGRAPGKAKARPSLPPPVPAPRPRPSTGAAGAGKPPLSGRGCASGGGASGRAAAASGRGRGRGSGRGRGGRASTAQLAPPPEPAPGAEPGGCSGGSLDAAAAAAAAAAAGGAAPEAASEARQAAAAAGLAEAAAAASLQDPTLEDCGGDEPLPADSDEDAFM